MKQQWKRCQVAFRQFAQNFCNRIRVTDPVQRKAICRLMRYYGFPALVAIISASIVTVALNKLVSNDWISFFLGYSILTTIAGVVVSYLLRRFPQLARQLGDRDEQVRQRAFERLLEMGNKAVPVFVQVLNEAPLTTPYSNWESTAAFCLAVEGLGRLKAREGVEPLMDLLRELEGQLVEVRAMAIWALGQIGDERAIPSIIPMLGDDRRIQSQWLNEWAWTTLRKEVLHHYGTVSLVTAAALKQLGLGELVTSFLATLRRDEEALKRLKEFWAYRTEIAAALMKVLDSSFVSEAANAAWALGELWAFEALPRLKAKEQALLTAKAVRKACQEAIAKLEPMATLPTPVVATGIDTSTLPRPAMPTDIATDTLPRPTEPPQTS